MVHHRKVTICWRTLRVRVLTWLFHCRRVVASPIMTKREQDDRMALVSTAANAMTQRARSRQY